MIKPNEKRINAGYIITLGPCISTIFPVNGLENKTNIVYTIKKKLAAFIRSISIAYKLIYDTITENEGSLKNIIKPIGSVFLSNIFLNDTSFLLLFCGTFIKNENTKHIIPKSRLI